MVEKVAKKGRGGRTKLANISLGPWEVDFLARRGARAHRGGDPFCRSTVLGRELRVLEALLKEGDPRPRLAAGVVEAAIALLAEGWSLRPLEVAHLEEVLAEVKGMRQVVEERGLEVKRFLGEIAGLPYVGKYALVELAVQARVGREEG